MKNFKLSEGIILGVLIMISFLITSLPPFEGATARVFTISITLFAAIVFGYARMFKTAFSFLCISLILILLILSNIKDVPIYINKNYSTSIVKVEDYYYHSVRGSGRSDEYIVCTITGSKQKVTFRLPTDWYYDSNYKSNEMTGEEYKIKYLPNTKQIMDIENLK